MCGLHIQLLQRFVFSISVPDMKTIFFFILLICSFAESTPLSKPFLIFSGAPYNHPTRGTAAIVNGDIWVATEQWVHETKMPFESSILVTQLQGQSRVNAPVKLFADSKRYFYNPQFLKIGETVFLYFNAFDPSTDTASFERSSFDGHSFSPPEILILNENLKSQYRPWIFVSSFEKGTVVMNYEWQDPNAEPNYIKMAVSSDGIHFGPSLTMTIAVMGRHSFFANGLQVFTYQNGDVNHMQDFFSLSRDGVEWSSPALVSLQRNLHDTIPFRRQDGKVDLYYIATGSGPAFSVFRRVLEPDGTLGPEQELTNKADGSVMEPHPTRLPDGRVLVILTKEVVQGSNYDLWGVYVDGDAPSRQRLNSRIQSVGNIIKNFFYYVIME